MNKESVPASEKIVSIFEEHTDIIVKRLREVEFGHKSTITAGASGLVLDLQIYKGNPKDSQIVPSVLKRHKKFYTKSPKQMVFDGCYYSEDNVKLLSDDDVEFTFSNCIFSKKYSWLAKLVIGISLGASGGLAFKGFFNLAVPQIVSSFKSIVVIAKRSVDVFKSFENIIFLITLLSVMYYFFFTMKQESVFSKSVSKTGRYLMMICFGAFFGSTIMARLSLLVERLLFLMTQWVDAVRNILNI